jgi:hypothetical protein
MGAGVGSAVRLMVHGILRVLFEPEVIAAVPMAGRVA